jgi:NADH-quinone oxidoreductase subunit L
VSLWLIPLLPLLAAIFCGILALTRKAEKVAPFITILAVLGSLATAVVAGRGGHVVFNWLSIPPGFNIALSVYLPPISWLMVLVVCIVSALVLIYSTGYMKGDNGYARYFAYLSLFTASMLGLVVADNLFQLYVCWELVGICSYLLVGFWWFKPSAANAAKKAFIVTRFGDAGFLVGVLLLVSLAGSFNMADVAAAVQLLAAGQVSVAPLVSPTTFLWLAPILLFCGAIGKSAQFPLHVWLPDAMEGPTPVSALIHAATMVAAGVYMVARLMPIFETSHIALDVVLIIGAITALMAATIALVQNDIKKVMAYSTISQLGYMMIGLGAGAAAGTAAGMFHLTTHAFFKALLFLTAGSVIHALHHSEEPNDLRKMGGLLKRMPITGITGLIGVLALAGFPGLSGFWSKDSILATVLGAEGGPDRIVALIGGIVGYAVAFLTAFYALRMWLMAFWGEPRSEHAARAHESGSEMWGPLVVLAIPSVVLGAALEFGGFTHFLLGEAAAEHGPNYVLMGIAVVVALAGMALAWSLYAKPKMETDPVTRMPAPLYNTFANLWGIDAFWTNVAAAGALAFGRTVAWFDRNVIDAAMHEIAYFTGRTGSSLRRATNGQAQWYSAVMLAGVILLAVLFVAWQNTATVVGKTLAAGVEPKSRTVSLYRK